MHLSRPLTLLVPLAFVGCAARPAGRTCPQVQTAAATTAKPLAKIGALRLDGVPELPQRIRRRMGQYLGVRHASFVDWDERGEGMLVRTRFGNTAQLHRVLQPLGTRNQLTFSNEPVASASWIPGSYEGAVLLRMDRGGAENAQLYRLDLLEGRTTRLTDGTSRNIGLVWARHAPVLAFASNARNGKDFDIYLGAPEKGTPFKLVHRGQGLFLPVDFSFDGKQLLLLEYVSLNRSYLHLLDLSSGKARKLDLAPTAPTKASGGKDLGAKGKPKAPVPAPARLMPNYSIRNARWAADGRGFFFTGDQNGEFVSLYYYDLRKGHTTPLSASIRWNVEELDISADGRTLAFSTNEKGYSHLYTMDTRSKRVRPAQVPNGILSELKFSRRKKSRNLVGFSLHLPTAPGDVYSFDVRRRKIERWTKSEVGGLNTDFLVRPKLIDYPTFDKVDGKPRMIPAFYFKPPGAGPHPVVITIHGGPEAQYRPYFRALTHYLVMELGVAVIAPNVRGSDGYGKSYLLLDNDFKREDSVKDIGALLDWIAAQKELDAKKVVVYGGSYGGYMVLASLTHFADRLRAGVDWVGISNFVSFLRNTKAYRRDLRRAEYGDEREPSMLEFLTKISPLNNVAKISAPLFVIQGANDPRVPRSEAEQIVTALRKKGGKVWYLLAENEGHGFRKKENRDVAAMLTVLFLEQMGISKAQTPPR